MKTPVEQIQPRHVQCLTCKELHHVESLIAAWKQILSIGPITTTIVPAATKAETIGTAWRAPLPNATLIHDRRKR